MDSSRSEGFLLADLPLDLARYIIVLGASDFKVALALVLTSKQLSTWAIPHLYKRVFLRNQVALDQFKTTLDSCSSRGRFVQTLSLISSCPDDVSLHISILAKTPSLVHLTWLETRPIAEPLPVQSFPASLRYFNVSFYGFHPSSWDNSISFPASISLKVLQVHSHFDFAESPIRQISLSSFTSLKYLLFRSNWDLWEASQFNAWLVSSLIPSFPDTLRVCVIFDHIYNGSRVVLNHTKALIL
ncbi:hypothetical protein DL96DRAFT_1580568, partial [Flagelloscypha sp. PMI_526]